MGNKVRTIKPRTTQLKPLINNVRVRDASNKRIRGRELQRINGEMKRRQPFCVECLAKGIETVAVVTDHIVPIEHNGPDTFANRQRLCKKCHDAKTASEGTERHNYNVY